jgi:hypothetical protein
LKRVEHPFSAGPGADRAGTHPPDRAEGHKTNKGHDRGGF